MTADFKDNIKDISLTVVCLFLCPNFKEDKHKIIRRNHGSLSPDSMDTKAGLLTWKISSSTSREKERSQFLASTLVK